MNTEDKQLKKKEVCSHFEMSKALVVKTNKEFLFLFVTMIVIRYLAALLTKMKLGFITYYDSERK